jgi:hypothetical protein
MEATSSTDPNKNLSLSNILLSTGENLCSEIVSDKLWTIFRLAVKGGLEERGEAYVQEIALLFDQLIDLVAAAHTLHQAGGAFPSNDLLTGQEGEGHE